MAFTNISTADVAVDKPITNEWAEKMIANDKDLNGRIASLGAVDLPNGSFEVNDTSVPGGAANWTVSTLVGGSATVSTGGAAGAQALKVTRIAGQSNGGAVALSDFFEWGGKSKTLTWLSKKTTGDIYLGGAVEFFDEGQSSISNNIFRANTLEDSTAWTLFIAKNIDTPANAKYIKVSLTAGATSTAADVGVAAGDIFLDAVSFQGDTALLKYNKTTVSTVLDTSTSISAGTSWRKAYTTTIDKPDGMGRSVMPRKIRLLTNTAVHDFRLSIGTTTGPFSSTYTSPITTGTFFTTFITDISTLSTGSQTVTFWAKESGTTYNFAEGGSSFGGHHFTFDRKVIDVYAGTTTT